VGVSVIVGVLEAVAVSVGVLLGNGVVVPLGVSVGVLVGVAVASTFGAFFRPPAAGATGPLSSVARLALAGSCRGPALADCPISAIAPQPSTSKIKTAHTDSHP
jgi:hypothetical protein